VFLSHTTKVDRFVTGLNCSSHEPFLDTRLSPWKWNLGVDERDETLLMSNVSNQPPQNRLVYIPSANPSRKRGRATAPRLHGAFTGGFSAGYFNTVGSEEGWQPQEQQLSSDVLFSNEHGSSSKPPETAVVAFAAPRPKQQRLEDFMDEQDHNEWGGPQAVKAEFSAAAAPTEKKPELIWSVDQTPPNIGRQLLRVLGYRGQEDGSHSALVPDINAPLDNDTQEPNEARILSRHRLRRIQVRQREFRIPKPKLDTVGLGYEPYLNAPEFRQYHLNRQQKRAADGRNVYRVSNVLPSGRGVEDRSKSAPADAHENDTVEDFIGTKTAGGFSLNDDDDDDVYDDQGIHGGMPAADMPSGPNVRSDQYSAVAYEPEVSDEDNPPTKHGAEPTKVPRATTISASQDRGSSSVGFLSSWIGGSERNGVLGEPAALETTAAGQRAPTTSDGNPILSGFMLGPVNPETADSVEAQQRFPGPIVPPDYIVQRHEFRPEELPSVIQVLAHADKLQRAEKRREEAMESLLATKKTDSVSGTVDEQARGTVPAAPLTGDTFAALALVMKNRFTSSTTLAESEPLPKEGALLLDDSHLAPVDTQEYHANKVPASIRTVTSFNPSPLLCKRFFVPVPTNSIPTEDLKAQPGSLFGDAALDQVVNSAAERKLAQRITENSGTLATTRDDGEQPDSSSFNDSLERPSISVLHSIFEPESEESSAATTDLDADSSDDIRSKGGGSGDIVVRRQDGGQRSGRDPEGSVSSSSARDDASSHQRRKKHSRTHKDWRRSRKEKKERSRRKRRSGRELADETMSVGSTEDPDVVADNGSNEGSRGGATDDDEESGRRARKNHSKRRKKQKRKREFDESDDDRKSRKGRKKSKKRSKTAVVET
jgi:Protein of unknown function (DUF1604)